MKNHKSLLFVTIIMVTMLGGCSSGQLTTQLATTPATASETKTTAPTTEASTTTSTTEAPTTTPTTTAPVKEFYQVGDRVTVKDLTLVYVSSGQFESDNQYRKPGEGNQFIFLEFYAEYNGKGSTSVSYFDFKAFADGYSVDQKYSFDDTLGGSISTGRWNQGKFIFEVPQNAQKVEIEYSENLFSDKVIKFLYEGEINSGFTAEKKTTPSEGAIQPGETVDTEHFKITYLGCSPFESDNRFIQPDEGYRFIYFEFEFEKTGSGERTVSSLNFNCYADGKVCDQKYSLRDDEISGRLSEGRKAKGTVAFMVPVDASVIEVEYEINMISGEYVVFSFVEP